MPTQRWRAMLTHHAHSGEEPCPHSGEEPCLRTMPTAVKSHAHTAVKSHAYAPCPQRWRAMPTQRWRGMLTHHAHSGEEPCLRTMPTAVKSHAHTAVKTVHKKHSTKKSELDHHGDSSTVRMASFWVEIKIVWHSYTSPMWPSLLPCTTTPPWVCGYAGQTFYLSKGLILPSL